MAFYDLPKEERIRLVDQIQNDLLKDLYDATTKAFIDYFCNEDTYVRKSTYLSVGRIYISHVDLQPTILPLLATLLSSLDEKTRQTAINAAGEIGKVDFAKIESFMEKGLFDSHSIVRNAVIGSIKKMGEKNPHPVMAFARRFLHHEDKEIRREICHGIELRGRTHPEDILPLLKELQFDKTSRVRNTLVHVIGQISYKKGCLKTVLTEIETWENRPLVEKAVLEIVDVHKRYAKFSSLSQDEAKAFILQHALWARPLFDKELLGNRT